MNAKKIAPLLIALLLGGVAVKMAFNLVQKKQMTLSLEQPKRPQMVIAKRGIDSGTVLTDDDLDMADVNTDIVPDNVFKRIEDVRNRVAAVPIVQGQAVAQTLLAPAGSGAGLQAAIQPGMRAISMDINEITGVAGYLSVGSHIDVIQTLRDEKTGLPIARTLVQNVRITAVGTRHNPNDPNNDGGGHSITLMVTPQQAELLELAGSTGRPRYSLRSSNDLALADTRGVSMAELIGHRSSRNDEFSSVPVVAPAIPATQPSTVLTANVTTRPSVDPESDQWTVQIIRGGSESEVKFAVHGNGNSNDGEVSHTDTSFR
jgi:pilus assembly protein CpaB